MSEVEDEVCELIQARAKKASIVKKYKGKTMVRNDLSHDEWLEHLQHELLDGAIYVQRLRTREKTIVERLKLITRDNYWDIVQDILNEASE